MAFKRAGGLSITQQVAKFIGVSVLAGAVTAGIALPAFGLMGLAAKGTVEGFDELPAELKRPPLSQRTTILNAEGEEIAKVYSRDRTVVDITQMSKYVQQALVAIEDSRFYEHGAIDLKGVLRALNENAQSGQISQGASTLTQQYVKNVFVEAAGDDKEAVAEATRQTIGRKIRELKYAIKLEEELTKKQILENYLNITYFGQGAYGVEAASQRFFSTSAKDLELHEAALLAGLVQSPSYYDPTINPERAKKRRDAVLNRMAEVGDISREEAKAAQAKDLGLEVSQPQEGCITAINGASFFCDYIEEAFLASPAFGETYKERKKRWDRGGLTIKTTLDPQTQNAIQKSIAAHVYNDDPVATAMTIVEPGTGKILGMGQSRQYGYEEHETELNLSVGRSMGGGGGYQTGSTFKPIVAAAALEDGVSVQKKYSSPYKMPYPSPVDTCGGTWENSAGSTVENENETEVGPYRMKEATALSINTYYVQLISDLGICPVIKTAEKMGLERADGEKLQQLPSITLGTQPMTPLTMASAYATFANNGVYCTPVAIESVTDAQGNKLDAPKSDCDRAISEKTAKTVNALLRGVVEDGTGRKAGLSDRDSAGKTGTTDFRKAAWFVGYTKSMAGAVWVGDPAGERGMVDITIGGVYHPKVFGASVPGPIWRDAMSGALEGRAAQDLSVVPIKEPKKEKPEGGDEDREEDEDRGGDDPGRELPDITIPPDIIGGNANGGGWGRGGRD